MNISGRVTQHDKYQVEMKFVCPIDHSRKVNDYHIDVFFFIPRNLQVDAQSYPKEKFYADLTDYLRLKTPEIHIADLAKEENNVFRSLAASLRNAGEDATEQLKMFCSVAKVAFRDGAGALLELPPAERAEQLSGYLDHVNTVLYRYRALRQEFPQEERFLVELFDLVDEFLSVTANAYKYQLWKQFDADNNVIAVIRESAEREIAYRKERNYPSVPDPAGDNAELLYRESTMKKTMASVLYLKTAVRKAGVLLENIFLSVAAAIAMIFVTGIAFLWRGLFLEEFSLSFFIVWVVAYMFKDRIKALLQQWFSSHRAAYAYDYNMKIYDAMDRKVGVCRESMTFRSEKNVDPILRELRDRSALSRHVNGPLSENVLCYRKQIELFTKQCGTIYRTFQVDGINDIVRFNVRDWLRKMDNPVRPVYYPAADGSLGALKAKRLYHINMLIRYGGNGQDERCMRFRLVLARNGIKSVEQVRHRKKKS